MVGKEFNKKTVRDIELAGKTVLLRADFNVPIKDGQISGDYRLRATLPTIEYILGQKPKKLVIIAHLGRPTGPDDKAYSLEPVAKLLSQMLDRQVQFMGDCVGDDTKQAIRQAPAEQVILLQNLRFYQGEEANDPAFAEALVSTAGAQVFVADGFGVVHRKHASTDAITKFLPSVAGLLLQKEVETINSTMQDPARPLTAVVGGAKISDKIDVLERFIEVCDCVAVGGALANDFLIAEGVDVAASLVDEDKIEEAREILAKARKVEKKRAFNFLVPVDVVASTSLDGRAGTRIVDVVDHALADIESYPKKPPAHSFNLAASEKIGDIGPASASLFAGAIKNSRSVIWSGTVGVTEASGIAGAHPPFSHGTQVIAEAIIGSSNLHAHKPFSIVGGGDTTAWVEDQDLTRDFNHVSTGGSACLELMAGRKLPGIEALEDK
jgi:phosphoglycerate kinase